MANPHRPRIETHEAKASVHLLDHFTTLQLLQITDDPYLPEDLRKLYQREILRRTGRRIEE